MARRSRINTGFLVLILTVVVVAAGGIAAVWKLRKPHNPAPYIQAADEDMKAYNWQGAAENLEFACSLLPQREDLHLKLGRCYLQLAKGGVDRFHDAFTEFNRAAELNPNDSDAWVGLLDVNEIQVAHMEGHAKDTLTRQNLSLSLGEMRDAADHLVHLKPDNVQAQSAGPIITLRSWILNLTLSESAQERTKAIADGKPNERKSNDQLAHDAMTELTRQMGEHPENEKIPFWLARAKIFEAQELIRTGHAGDAQPLYAEASTMFDADIAARPEVVGLYLQKAAILSGLRDMDNRPNNDYLSRLHETLSQVQGMVDPVKSPEDYERAKLMWADNLGRTDLTGAEDVYRKLIETFPDHLYDRLQLARLLQRANRPTDAIAVLEDISKLPGPPVTELARRDQWDQLVASSKLVRASIETEQFMTTRSGEARDKLAKDIQASLDSAKRRYAGTSLLLRAQGRFELANGQTRDAIDTLTSAAEKMNAEGGNIDYQLLHDEAAAYSAGGQANKAVDLLQRAMVDPVVANNNDIHLTLAQMNLQNQDYAKARPYIDWLVARLPHSPEVILLEIRELGPDAPWDKVKPLFDDLPEKNIPDIAMKANEAMVLKNSDEATRLLTVVNKDNPADVRTAVNLATYYQMAGKLDDATDVIQKCIDKNPTDPTLPPMLLAVKSGTSSKEVTDATLVGLAKIEDPFKREMETAAYYGRLERPEDELAHLLKAQAIQPNNVQVLSTIFTIYIDNSRFPEAQAMIPHMADLDCDMCHGVMLRCKLALKMNDIPAAVQFGRQMTHDEPNFGASWEMYGEALQASGDLSLACEQYQAALLLEATNINAMTNLINCNVQRGKLETARSDLEQECRRYPNNPTFRNMRQRFVIEHGDPQSILGELNDQIEQHPDDKIGYLMDIEALKACVRREASQGNADAADLFQKQTRDRFQQATDKWPDDLRIASGYADLYMQANDITNAEKVVRTVADRPRWKNEPRPLILLGQIYLSANKFAQAEETLKAAQRIQPNSVETLLNLAACMQYQGRLGDAVAVLEPGLSNFQIRKKYTELLLSIPDRSSQADLEVSDAMTAQPGNRALIDLMLEVYYTEALQGISGKREVGIKLATDTINADRASIFASLWRGKLLATSANPDLDSAAADLLHYLDAVPDNADAHFFYARILDAKRDRDNALRELQTAIKLSPHDRAIRIYLINDLINAVPMQTVEAERLLQSTLALPEYAHDPDFETQEALLLAAKDDQKDKALKMIQQAVKDAGANKASIVPDYFKVLMMTRNFDLLLSESEKYVSDPHTPWYVFSDRGVAKAAEDDIPGAVADFGTALDKAGTEPTVGAAMTVVATMSTNNKMGVDKALAMVLPRAQNSPLWQMVAGDLLIQKRDFSNARTHVEAALGGLDQFNSQDQLVLIKMAANLYLSASPPDLDKAAEYYRKLLAVQPNDITSLNDIACILVDRDPSQALIYSTKAYDLATRKGSAYQPRIADTQGWALIQNGKLSEGIQLLHNAEDQQFGNADFPDVHYHLAMGYMLKHQPATALTDLTKAHDLIAQMKENHLQIDEALSAKVESAIIQANQSIQAKNDGKPSP